MACDTVVGNVTVTYTSDKGFKTGSRTAKFMVPVPVVVVVSFTLSLRTKATLLSPYAILIIAVDAAAAGNTIVKSPAVDVLSPPKSMVATEALVADEL